MTDAIYVRRFRIPNAATRSIINGDSFGDNMLGALPDIIGNTVGNALAGGLARPSNAKTAARDQATAIALSVDPNLSISQEDTAAINELADAQVALGKALANDKKVADKKGDPSFRSEKSHLAQREYDRRLNAMLDTRARSDAGWAAVDDYRTKMREAILGGSNSGLAVSGGEDQVIVKGDPDNIKYMASRQIDGAGIWIGKEKENLTNRFSQFMQENPGAAIALQVADTGMKIAAPGKAALGWLFEKASDPIKGLISDGYSNAGWSQENSNHGGEGIYTASSLLLNGLGGIHAKVGGAGNTASSIWTSKSNKSGVENAYGHWKKHRSDFPEYINSKQYVEGARKFLNSPPPGTMKKIRANGDVILYNPKTNTFGIKTSDGTPKTMFKPDPANHKYPTNKDYFDAQ